MPFHVPVFAVVAENPFLARSPWRTPRFHPKRKAEQPCRPSPRASSRFPSVPPCPSLKTPNIKCMSLVKGTEGLGKTTRRHATNGGSGTEARGDGRHGCSALRLG